MRYHVATKRGAYLTPATRRNTSIQPRTTCTVSDPYRPLREFDLRGSCQYDTTAQQTTSRSKFNRDFRRGQGGQLQQRQHKRQRNTHNIEREAVLLTCYASTLPPREQFTEPRGYLDEGSMYTTCDAPGDTKATSAFAATAITPPSALPPPEPPDPIEQAPCDSGCNLPITNPQTVEHFKLASLPWPHPRWIKFGNGKRECSTHYIRHE